MPPRTVPQIEAVCPGCRLRMPATQSAACAGYYYTSAECWGVYAEVLGFEYSNAVVFGQVHQLTVDTYALQHAGGRHPDKSVVIHLAGLHAAFDLEMPPSQIPRLRKRLAENVDRWPHFDPPKFTGPMTVFDVALAPTPAEHMERIRTWAGLVWQAWSAHHPGIAAFVETHGRKLR